MNAGWGWLLVALAWASPSAALDLRVVGLFKDRAVVVVEGQRRLLRVGESSPEGVVLLSADSEEALLEVAGERLSYRLDGSVGGAFRPRPRAEVRIVPAAGMYLTPGTINGVPVRFLVDTGAGAVVINAALAGRLGIDYRRHGRPAVVVTASGRVTGYHVTLDRVAVGGIERLGVGGVVLEGAQPGEPLLGATFLGGVEMERTGASMLLRER